MTLADPTDTANRLIETAVYFGASLAGLVAAADLHDSPSPRAWKGSLATPSSGTVLVLALVHGEANPALDWWDGPTGGTPGNRRLIKIGRQIVEWLKTTLAVATRDLAYTPEKDGVFLKDAAVLAGLGAVGKNNLLITPNFGPRVRLRGLLLDADLPPTAPLPYSPCDGCDMPCFRACPRDAFATGSYHRADCMEKMNDDETTSLLAAEDKGRPMVIAYCRECEMSCPLGKGV